MIPADLIFFYLIFLLHNAGDASRELVPNGPDDVQPSLAAALKAVYEVTAEEGLFDDVIAYSEGSIVGGSLILDEGMRLERDGRKPQIKMAIFFAGWPQILADADQLMLLDECDIFIDIPTCHVMGSGDPCFLGFMALFNVCNGNLAEVFDRGKGHMLPGDPQTITELGAVIKTMIENSSSSRNEGLGERSALSDIHLLGSYVVCLDSVR